MSVICIFGLLIVFLILNVKYQNAMGVFWYSYIIQFFFDGYTIVLRFFCEEALFD